MAIKLSDYLMNYLESKGRAYTLEMFEADVGIKAGTLSAMMKPGKDAQMIKIKHLRALIRFFGKDFTDKFDLTPPDGKG